MVRRRSRSRSRSKESAAGCTFKRREGGVWEGGGGAHEGLSGFEKRVKKLVKLVAKIACHCNTQTKERLEAGKGRQIKRRKSQATKKRKRGPWVSPVRESGHGQCLA